MLSHHKGATMEYHYSDLCVLPADHPLTGPYASEYVQPYLLQPQGEAEYEVRNTVLVDGGDRFGVSAAVFDKSEELIWMGNQGGHVTSYYGPAMQKYTSFQIHESEEVRDIITADEGIFALTKTTLRHQLRRGIPKFTYRSPNMSDMQCLYQPRSNKLLMGGHQDKLIEFDLGVQKETVVPITEDGCAVLRSGGGSIVACGSANGTVTLRDLRCPSRAEQTIHAHTACLSDLDMQGNLLITCGFTQSSLGVAQAEPYVVVWDVRKVRNGGIDSGAWTAPTASVPLLLHFVPAFSGRAIAVAGDGHVTLLHVNSPNDEQSVFQVDTQNSICSVMDVSSTSQALIFGDQSGHLHLFSPQHNHEPVFNNFSRETEFAEPVVGLPYVPFTDTTFQFSTIPHPSLQAGGNGRYFNQLPDNFFAKHYRIPKPIDPEVLKTMKMQGPIGYAPNPRTFRRNQMPYVEDTLEDLSPKHVEFKINNQPIPRHYQKLDIRVNKNGPNDELDNFNKTGFPGLESTLPNSYCNAMLQVLYYTAAVKATLLAHTCAKEFCLSCELGFLFRMLDTSNGAPCQATNFLRAFRTVPEAAALGLILPDRGPEPRVDLVSLVQSWNRFILHQMHSDIVESRRKEKEQSLISQNGPKMVLMNHAHKLANSPVFNGKGDEGLEFLGPSRLSDGFIDGEWIKGHDEGLTNMEGNHQAIDLTSNHNDNEESEITELFAIIRHQLNRCLKCNKEEERESVVLACALQYPPPSAIKDAAAGEVKGGFVDLLLASLALSRSTPAWCDNCSRFSPTLQQGRAIRLPPILAINCGGVTAHEKSFWAKSMQREVPDGIRRGPTTKPCRYGLHCARPGCRFRHPDRPGSTQAQLTTSPVKEADCILPHQLSIRLSADGDIFINDKTEPSNEFTQNGKLRRKRFKPMQVDYSLSAAVICVEDNPRNLVAYVKKSGTDDQPHWYLINDLCIQPVSADEVVHCGSWWKSACVLLYTSRNVTAPPPPPPTVAS